MGNDEMDEKQVDKLKWEQVGAYGWRATEPGNGTLWSLSSCGDGQGGRVVPLYQGATLVGVFGNSRDARARAEELRKGVFGNSKSAREMAEEKRRWA